MSYHRNDCHVCGDKYTNNGLGRAAHERGKRHRAAIQALIDDPETSELHRSQWQMRLKELERSAESAARNRKRARPNGR